MGARRQVRQVLSRWNRRKRACSSTRARLDLICPDDANSHLGIASLGPASEIASQVRTGRIRATDVTADAIESARAADEQLNAYTLIDEDGAFARAAEIDALVAEGRDPGPLAGVPVGLKDLIDQRGLPNTRGSAFEPALPLVSAEVVTRLNKAGAIVIGRTGLHEFAFGFTSENPWHGAVHNPWDLSRSPGGSSGGSAATVAAGTVPISIGTDTGGSVRVPAALCGIYGLKVTHGRVPLTGVFPLVSSFDTVGPLARSIDDLATSYLAIAGDDPADPWSQPVGVETPLRLPETSSIRIGIVRQWFDAPHTSEIGADISRFIAKCDSIGIDMAEVDEEALRPIDEVTTASRAEVLEVHGARFSATPELYGEDVRRRIADSFRVENSDIVASQRWRSNAKATVSRLASQGFDVLLAPTVGVMEKYIGDDYVDIDGASVFHRTALASFTAPINAIGVPALSVPLLDSRQPGTSVQLVAHHWSEATLLGLAEKLENHGIIGVRQPPLFADR